MLRPSRATGVAIAIRLHIERLGFRGDGLGVAADGARYRVAATVPGDVVEAEPIELEHGPPRAALVRVLEPGPDRVDAGCDQHVACPGCQLRQLAYARQVEHIVAGWQRVLRRAVGLSRDAIGARTLPAVPVLPRDGYRTRATARLARVDDRLTPVMRARRGADCAEVDLTRCPVQHSSVRQAMHAVCAAIQACAGDLVEPMAGRGWLVVERSSHDDRLRLTLSASTDGERLRCERLAWALHAEHPAWSVRVAVADPDAGPPDDGQWVVGRGALRGGLVADPIEVPSQAWITATPHGAARVAELLFQAVDALPDDQDGVVELGCGVGVHATGLSARIPGSYLGIDLSRAAIAAAQAHADHDPCRQFRVGRADRALKRIVVDGVRASVVVIHPMRRGIGADVGRYLGALGARHALHVSPTAGALADDARMLAAGFELRHWQLVDTMPHTYHAMSVARFDRA